MSKAPYAIGSALMGIATFGYLNSRESDFQQRVNVCLEDPYSKFNEGFYKLDVRAVDTFMWSVVIR